MAWAAALDRMTATCRDTYPQAVVYDPSGGAHALTGIFDEAAERVEPVDGVALTTTKPLLTMRIADLAAVGLTAGVQDLVQIGGVTYEVREIAPDSSGMVELWLVRVS